MSRSDAGFYAEAETGSITTGSMFLKIESSEQKRFTFHVATEVLRWVKKAAYKPKRLEKANHVSSQLPFKWWWVEVDGLLLKPSCFDSCSCRYVDGSANAMCTQCTFHSHVRPLWISKWFKPQCLLPIFGWLQARCAEGTRCWGRIQRQRGQNLCWGEKRFQAWSTISSSLNVSDNFFNFKKKQGRLRVSSFLVTQEFSQQVWHLRKMWVLVGSWRCA